MPRSPLAFPLTDDERAQLHTLAHRGKTNARTRACLALTGEQVAHVVALACTPAPDGHDHWTVRLLANKVVELGYITHISPETISRALKKRVEAVAA